MVRSPSAPHETAIPDQAAAGAADRSPARREPPHVGVCVLRAMGSALATRSLLSDVDTRLRLSGIDPEVRQTVEIVLAEVLNNVVEHAYTARPGPIEVRLSSSQDGIRCEVLDEGGPMARDRPPLAQPSPVPSDLPEGGFGWGIIRALTCDLDYRRHDGRNRLAFRIPV